MASSTDSRNRTSWGLIASKAATSALEQVRRGAAGSTVRGLYQEAHSLVRTVRRHLAQAA